MTDTRNNKREPAMFGFHLIQFAKAYAGMTSTQRASVEVAVETDDYVAEDQTEAICSQIAKPLAMLINNMSTDDDCEGYDEDDRSVAEQSLMEMMDRIDGWAYVNRKRSIEPNRTVILHSR
jgi:hypothetical protein